MWDEEDGFFYDVLQLPNGESQRLKVRSMVGLLPLCAATVFDGKLAQRFPDIITRYRNFLAARPELLAFILAFKFGVTAARFDARKQLVLTEAVPMLIVSSASQRTERVLAV